MNIACWNCAKEIKDLPTKISFREICPHCHAYLHCCKNCTNYQVGLSNDCKIPGTELISDREARNTCEEFVLMGKAKGETKGNVQDVLKRLFGE